MPEIIAERIGDMGEGTKLQVFKEEDGDFIISVMSIGHRIPEHQIQFCVPGIGGGCSPETWQALCALHEAILKDNEMRSQSHRLISGSPT